MISQGSPRTQIIGGGRKSAIFFMMERSHARHFLFPPSGDGRIYVCTVVLEREFFMVCYIHHHGVDSRDLEYSGG